MNYLNISWNPAKGALKYILAVYEEGGVLVGKTETTKTCIRYYNDNLDVYKRYIVYVYASYWYGTSQAAVASGYPHSSSALRCPFIKPYGRI